MFAQFWHLSIMKYYFLIESTHLWRKPIMQTRNRQHSFANYFTQNKKHQAQSISFNNHTLYFKQFTIINKKWMFMQSSTLMKKNIFSNFSNKLYLLCRLPSTSPTQKATFLLQIELFTIHSIPLSKCLFYFY